MRDEVGVLDDATISNYLNKVASICDRHALPNSRLLCKVGCMAALASHLN